MAVLVVVVVLVLVMVVLVVLVVLENMIVAIVVPTWTMAWCR